MRKSLKGANDPIKLLESQVKADNVDPIFNRNDSNQTSIEDNGKLIKRIKDDGCWHCVYASKGYNEGIKKFQIKIGRKWYSRNQIGVVTKIYNGEECKNKFISTDNGIGIDDLNSNDIIVVILNFNLGLIYFMVNGVLKKEQKLINDKTYYPAIEIWHNGNSCRVLNV